MSDPLSVISAVVGLVAVSAQLGVLSKQLYDSAKEAPASMARIKEEMDHLNIIFVQVEFLVKGTAKKKPSKTRMTMLSLHDLMTILSGCVLLFSKLQKKLGDVAGLVDPATQLPVKGAQFTLDRIKWALWKEEEVGVILQDLQRYKSSLHLMLTVVQCNRAAEANESLDRLHDLVEKIAESNFETSMQLRELIRRPEQHDASSIYNHSASTSEENADHEITVSTNLASSLALESAISLDHADHADSATIRTNATSFSIRSVLSLIPSFTDGLSRSRAYKRLRPRSTRADSDAASIFSKDSKATKGDRWSLLSDISLGDLSISEISVFELPICLGDVYDPEPYKLAVDAQPNQQPQLTHQRRGRLAVLASGGRLHNAVRSNNDFALRTLIALGADLEEKDSNGDTPLVHAVKINALKTCQTLLDKGAMVDIPDSSGRTPLSYAASNPSGLGIVKFLLDQGATVDTPDCSGRTPFPYSVSNSSWKCIEFCKLLLDRGAIVEIPDSLGRTPLSYSAERGDVGGLAMCHLLLNLGAMVDTPDSSGRTPLSYAASGLFEGRSPAAKGPLEKFYLQICKLLIDNGAKADTRDSTGHTPYWHAKNSRQETICKYFTEIGGKESE